MPYIIRLLIVLAVAIVAGCALAQPQQGGPVESATPSAQLQSADEDAFTGCTSCALRHRSFQESRERRQAREAEQEHSQQ